MVTPLLVFMLTKPKEQTQKQKTVKDVWVMYSIEDLLSEIVLRGTYRVKYLLLGLICTWEGV